MDIQFLFIDDSLNEDTMLSSLTGILIPLDTFEKIRDDFYNRILNQFIFLGENNFNLNPPNIHGKELLKGTVFENNDEKKIEIFRTVTEIVNENSIKVYKLAWLKDEGVKIYKNLDTKLMGIIFPYFIELIDKDIQDIKVIPIMDGLDINTSKIFSQFIKTSEILGRTTNKNNLTIKNSKNIYGEVFYADSRFSVFIQLVDVISYMLHCNDYKKFDKVYGSFKSKIIEVAEKIKPELVNHKYYFTKIDTV
jgi:hypothetical protein